MSKPIKSSSEDVAKNEIPPRLELFHDDWIKVQPKELSLSEITYWPQNDRTKFTFERLERLEKKQLAEIPLEKIVEFVTGLPLHKLGPLARSIERNGVRVPLIVLDDGTLLDGNRRFFACHLIRQQALKEKRPEPESIHRIPVWEIKSSDLSPRQRLKILAEANFVPDLKLAWPDGAKAKVVEDYYKACLASKQDHDQAIEDISSIFAISPSIATQWLETIQVANEFISGVRSEKLVFERRQIVEENFVYFWEFRNKALKGRAPLDAETELPDVKKMFFRLMAKVDGFQNIKQIEPMIRARRDPDLWKLLVDSKGAKLSEVVVSMNEKLARRAAEDKARQFFAWVKKLPLSELTPKVRELLKQLGEECIGKSTTKEKK